MNKKAFKDHEVEEHDYFRIVCDEDYDNSDQLLEHKINSDNHICCGVFALIVHSTGQETGVTSTQTNAASLQPGPRPPSAGPVAPSPIGIKEDG